MLQANTLINVKVTIQKVAIIHNEFYRWRKETTFVNLVSLRKQIPHLLSFIALCNAQLIANPPHENVIFQFTETEAVNLCANILYLVDAPPTLTALREKLLIRLETFASPIKNHKLCS